MKPTFFQGHVGSDELCTGKVGGHKGFSALEFLQRGKNHVDPALLIYV